MVKAHQYTDVAIGDQFNKLTLLTKPRRLPNGYKVKVRCLCGTVKDVWAKHVVSGQIKSCGCLRSETTSKKNFKHGQSHTRLYKIWSGMKKRCNNANTSYYQYWGGKGIKVCKQWASFRAFYIWATRNGYRDHLTIDRIHDGRNYKPSNCRWIPLPEQSHSKHKPVRRSDGVEYVSLKEAAKTVGLKRSSSIVDVLKGRSKTAAGFGWEYI